MAYPALGYRDAASASRLLRNDELIDHLAASTELANRWLTDNAWLVVAYFSRVGSPGFNAS